MRSSSVLAICAKPVTEVFQPIRTSCFWMNFLDERKRCLFSAAVSAVLVGDLRVPFSGPCRIAIGERFRNDRSLCCLFLAEPWIRYVSRMVGGIEPSHRSVMIIEMNMPVFFVVLFTGSMNDENKREVPAVKLRREIVHHLFDGSQGEFMGQFENESALRDYVSSLVEPNIRSFFASRPVMPTILPQEAFNLLEIGTHELCGGRIAVNVRERFQRYRPGHAQRRGPVVGTGLRQADQLAAVP